MSDDIKVGVRYPVQGYTGVYFRWAQRLGKKARRSDKENYEKVYYITFRKDGHFYEEKAGRQYANNMTPAKANAIRAELIEGKRPTRKEKRLAELAERNNKQLTIGNLWEYYWAHKQKVATTRRLDKTEFYNYNNYLHVFAKKIPSEIRTFEINKLRDDLEAQKKQSQTIKHIIGLLQRIINYGVKNALCSPIDSSLLHFEFPKIDNQKTEVLSEQQLNKLLQVLHNEPNRSAASFMLLALSTGMRRGALMALKWSDIDFESGFIKLRGDVAKKRKTERIPMSPSTRDILKTIQNIDSGSEYVFPGKNGGQRKEFRRIANRIKKEAALPDDFRPLHGLRHVFASYKASSGGVDLYTLQKLLTHSSPQMTQRYAHLNDERLKQAASVESNLLSPAPAANSKLIKSATIKDKLLKLKR